MNNQQGSSRLQKLLRLIEVGSSLETRQAAGDQIAAIVATHPAQLPSILIQVSRHLRHKDWDARVAAGYCIGKLSSHVVHHTPSTLTAAAAAGEGVTVPATLTTIKSDPEKRITDDDDDDHARLSFDSFSVTTVVEQGTPLLASAGEEYDFPGSGAGAGRKDSLAEQRTNLKKRLGLGGAADAFINTNDFFADEDLMGGGEDLIATTTMTTNAASMKSDTAGQHEKKGATELLAGMTEMSARERAAAARKAKAAKRKGPIGDDGGGGGSTVGNPAAKRAKTDGGGEQQIDPGTDYEALDAQWQAALSGHWPFQQLSDQLLIDILHPRWEVRHGAALALREILSTQGSSAAVFAPLADPPGGWIAAEGHGKANLISSVSAADVAAALASNSSWLEDCTIHLLCTLALDRFGDYVSDQVVAPVRETAAQALGVVARDLHRPILLRVLSALRSLAECSNWEARHGGLQGLKYVLAAQKHVDNELLSMALPSSIVGLRDSDDDVRAVAAEALLPAARLLAEDASENGVRARSLVWDVLLGTDELSPAVKGATSLLAAMYSVAAPEAACVRPSGPGSQPLSALAPRLWPHLRHNLSSVRLSAVRCLQSLLETQAVAVMLPGVAELSRAVRLLFQNIVLENDAEVLQCSQRAWSTLVKRASSSDDLAAAVTGPVLEALFTLASTPTHRKFDTRLFVPANDTTSVPQGMPGGEGEGQLERATRAKLAAAQALGELAFSLSSSQENPSAAPLVAALRSSAASSRVVAGFVIATWAELQQHQQEEEQQIAPPPQQLLSVVQEALAALITPAAMFDEHVSSFALLERQLTALREVAASSSSSNNNTPALLVETATATVTIESALTTAAQVFAAPFPDAVKMAAQAVHSTASVLHTKEAVLRSTVAAALAAAVVNSGQLPPKLNVLIQPLIASVRREPEAALQEHAGRTLAKLVVACTSRNPSPSDKIVKNVCGFACGDPEAVPNTAKPPVLGEEEVKEQQQQGGKGKGKSGGAAIPDSAAADQAAQAAALTRRGGEAMLQALAKESGAALPSLLPGLWTQHITASVSTASLHPQLAVEGLRTLQVLAPALHAAVVPHTLTLLPSLSLCLGHSNSAVQLSAARALAALCCAYPEPITSPVLDVLSPLLAAGPTDAFRLGAVVSLREIVDALGLRMVPFVQLAVVPLLGRMSDPHPGTRAIAAKCFAAVVALMPLAQGVPPPAGLSPAQEATLAKEGQFLQQLLDNKKMEDYALPFQLLTGTLRRYQQEGINWLAFLRRFGLHGVLADDMGLGKTLQATSIVAAATIEAKQKNNSAADADAPCLASLIVCPATLVSHWPHEIAKFVDTSVLRCLQYHGSPAARAALRPLLSSHDVVVMSYEALRADVEWVAGIKWMYCVLDEGHAIRNPASKVAQAARRVNAQHRLLLSGTPIQNSVMEMWALFDFLMPAFLGGERAFNSRYGRALAASRGAKKGSTEAEAGVLALDALHRQVMPFVLRRTKDQVLQDLPPKTVQDVMCEPGELQRALYEDFSVSQAMTAVVGAVQSGSLAAGGSSGSGGTSSNASGAPHVFQALHYLRRLCSHPLLVLDPAVPAHSKAMLSVLGPKLGADWTAAQAHLRADLSHSPKLAALRELLIDCGIGTAVEDTSGSSSSSSGANKAIKGGGNGDALAIDSASTAATTTTTTTTGSGHRALIFSQTRAMLDFAETTVLQPMGISSLRIDGTVEASERFKRVQRFNADPTFEVMLLTTTVGGLGLNLTAADTVIFLEHDWNPQKDLQAMDRAHRLGQRRAVNVYRLLVKGTLEEQVMSLQKFKIDVAAAVVNADNMSMTNMDTGNLLDLFALQEGKKQQQPGSGATAAPAGGAGGSGLAAVLAELNDPASAEAQYGEEFDLESFKQKMLGRKS